jgi:hypothetical protein
VLDGGGGTEASGDGGGTEASAGGGGGGVAASAGLGVGESATTTPASRLWPWPQRRSSVAEASSGSVEHDAQIKSMTAKQLVTRMHKNSHGGLCPNNWTISQRP